jgi:TRAP transporter TAXI family solute receptor
MIRTILFAAALALSAAAARADDRLAFFSVGGGELDVGYDRAVRAICEAVNAGHAGRLRCSPETTPGARYNLDALLSGDVGFGVVQWDLALQAVVADPDGPLRLVARLFDESFTLLTRNEARVARLADLEGKRVDIGQPASGRHATTRAVLAATGVDTAGFAQLLTISGAAAVDELCAGRLDAVAFVIGHPSVLVARALETCDARITPLAPAERRAVLDALPAFHADAIAADMYEGMRADAPTVALSAVLLARADRPAPVVEAVAATLLARREALGAATALLQGLDPETMGDAADGPPLHPGARTAFSAAR